MCLIIKTFWSSFPWQSKFLSVLKYSSVTVNQKNPQSSGGVVFSNSLIKSPPLNSIITGQITWDRFQPNLARNPVRSKHFTSSGGQVGHIAWGFSGSPGFSTCFFHPKPSLTPSCGGFSLSHGVQSLSRTRLLLPDSEHFCLNWCFILMQSLPRKNAQTDTHTHTHYLWIIWKFTEAGLH